MPRLCRALLVWCVLDASVHAAAARAQSDDALVEDLYSLAFEALARGQREQAADLLHQLVDQYPQHRLAAQASELLGVLRQPAAPPGSTVSPASPPPPMPPSAAEPKHTTAARAELIFVQTVHGLVLGVELCAVVGCDDVRPWALSLMAGAGGGLALSAYASRDGVTPGLARTLTVGVEWGAFNAFLLGNATSAFDGPDGDEAVAGGLMLGQLAGLGLGLGLAHWLSPTAGQASLTSSGGIWVTAASLLGMVIVSDVDSGEEAAWTAWGAGVAGLAAGGLLASRVPMSTSRVLLIDAGGLLGVVAGAGVGLLVVGDDGDARLIATTALLGLGSGLGLAVYLTRELDSVPDEARTKMVFGLMPVPHGAQATARLSF